jgi:hypothetical protein
MKTKSIVLAGALGLSLVNMASAVNYVYMTGSTAARGQVYNTLIDGTSVFDAVPTFVGQSSGTASKCQYMNFTGHLIGDPVGVVTTVKCDWSGSEAGIQDLVGGNENFLDDSAVSSSSSPGPFVSSPVDLAMADNAVSFSHNPHAPVTGTFVGVIPFKWVKEKGSLADVANVTACAARVLLAGGNPAALVTGNSADTTWVYVTGRDNNSGTRVNTFGDTGFGINSTPYQLEVAANGSMIDQVPPTGTYLGNYGYSGGGSVATQMGYDLSQATSQDLYTGSLLHFSVIAYLGYSDAGTAVGNGGTELTYEGVAESTAAVREGQYQFWGNEFLYRKSVVSSQAANVYGYLSPAATGINGHADNLALIDLRTMDSQRNGPTSDCVHN